LPYRPTGSEQELEPVYGNTEGFCYSCGFPLASSVERRIGVHIRCVHAANEKERNKIDLKVPSYAPKRS
jgi:hypothetical protein